MDPRKQSDKEELTRRLASSRAVLHLPDTRQMIAQSKQLIHAASKLPATMQARPARSILIVGGVACVVALVMKPRRKRRRRDQAAVAMALSENRTVPRQLMGWSLTLLQPLLRVWITEQARRYMKR